MINIMGKNIHCYIKNSKSICCLDLCIKLKCDNLKGKDGIGKCQIIDVESVFFFYIVIFQILRILRR